MLEEGLIYELVGLIDLLLYYYFTNYKNFLVKPHQLPKAVSLITYYNYY
jgi:hypothetical protein